MGSRGKLGALRREGADGDRRSAVEEYFHEGSWPRLSPLGFTVWAALWSEAVPLTGLVSASHEKLRRLLGLRSKSTVNRALAELTATGYLARLETRAYRQHYPYMYRFLRRGERGPGPESALEKLLVELLTQEDPHVKGEG